MEKIDANRYELLIPEEKIRERVRHLAGKISHDYRGRCPLLIGVLNGGFIFLADLIREIDIQCEVDFIKISSYGPTSTSAGEILLLKDVDCEVAGRDVLIVEDIIDSGLSVKFLEKKFLNLRPRSLKFVALLVKPQSAKVDYTINYVGFSIPNYFVVGYGLDYAENFRNLRGIYVMKSSTATD